ncbi:MAG: MFS transporter, partial [Chloroflexota bacterium]|nr:MFS transporter [Chloroflexota bacterium]
MGEALRTRAFWMLTVAATVHSAVHGAVFVHVIAYLTEVGIATELAGLTVMFITLLSLVGRIGLAWLSDLWDK